LTNRPVSGNDWSRTNNLSYDAGGRIVTQKLSNANGALMTTNTYAYDLTDQLLSGSGTATYSASYDSVGNRTNADGRAYTVNNLNQYTGLTSPSQNLIYDANGNLTNWNGTTFLHDSQGQLVNCSASSYAPKTYDYCRLRVFEGSSPYNGQLYTYDAGGNLLERYHTPAYTCEDYVYADGIDEVVLMYSTSGASAIGLFAVVTDHLGSVAAIVASNGTSPVETYEYSPFGKTTIRWNGQPVTTSAVGNVLGFTGREIDGGLYYYRNRWYSPDLGRFLEPDPIGLRARDVSLYRYVGNEPISRTDPEGASALIGGVLVVVVTFWFLVQVGKKIKKKQESINPVDDPLGIGVTPVVPPIICKEIAKGALCGPVTPAGSGVELVTGVAKAVVVDEAVETACPSP
jgi:RHS repeat-associated protein